jgi:hypothetical protein
MLRTQAAVMHSKLLMNGCIDHFGARTGKLVQTKWFSAEVHQFSDYYRRTDSERKEILDEIARNRAFLSEKSLKHESKYAKSFIQMRHDIEKLSKSTSSSNVDFQTVDKVASEWLGEFFSQENVELKTIEAENENILTLDAIVEREKVLDGQTVDSLKARLSNGRYLYGIFHPRLPFDPLVFVHVALTNDFTSTMREIDSNTLQAAPQYAIFYSINSSYPALKNLGLPQLLLRLVKAHVAKTAPSVHTYSTLSPIPGFLKWLTTSASGNIVLPERLEQLILKVLDERYDETAAKCAIQRLKNSLIKNPTLVSDPMLAGLLKEPLMWLCAHYLSQETKVLGNGKVTPLGNSMTIIIDYVTA